MLKSQQESFTKKDLSLALSSSMGLPVSLCKEFVNAFFEEMVSVILTEGEFVLSGIGKFYLNEKSERMGFDISKKKLVPIAKKQVFGFSSSRSIRNQLKR